MSKNNSGHNNPEIIRNTMDSHLEPMGRTISDVEYRLLGGIPAKSSIDRSDKAEPTCEELADRLASGIYARAEELKASSVISKLVDPPLHLYVDDGYEFDESKTQKEIKSDILYIKGIDKSIDDIRPFYTLNFYLPNGCEVGMGEYGLSIYEGCVASDLDISDGEDEISEKVNFEYSVSHQEILDNVDEEDNYEQTDIECVISGSAESEKFKNIGEGNSYFEFTDTESMIEFFNLCINSYVKNEKSHDFFTRVIGEFNGETERIVMRKSQQANSA